MRMCKHVDSSTVHEAITAAKRGDLPLLKRLVETGVDPTAKEV